MTMETNKVYAAIAKVMAGLGKDGIQKDRKNVQQGYSFRGIDDVYNALHTHLVAANLVILPRFSDRQVVERQSQKGGALFYVTVSGDFDLVSTEDGSKHTVGPFFGEAMDSGDKATNKAMSAAYKYMAMEVFCIPTDADNDSDATTHEVKPNTARQVAVDAFDAMPTDEKKFLQGKATELIALVESDQGDVAGFLDGLHLQSEEKLALWSLLPSQVRTAIKKAQEADKVSKPRKPTNAELAMQA
jgi:ERF superfamily protein